MKAVSLFSGAGGIDLGFEAAGGYEILSLCEIDPHAIKVLEHHWPEITLIKDVKEISDLGAAEIVYGGFPCQDISQAGRGEGLSGEKSGLWSEFARLIDKSRPQWILIENVSGLLYSGGRRDLGSILGALGKLGYGFAYRVLDARWFGVPQRRRRVFIIGCLGRSDCAAKVLLEPEGLCGHTKKSKRKRNEDPEEVKESTGKQGHVIAFHPTQDVDLFSSLSSTACSAAIYENQRAELNLDAEATWSLSVKGGKPGQGYQAIIEHDILRRLTPLEYERLMGWPDEHTKPAGPDSHRYRLCGNGVVAPVAEWIARRILEVDSMFLDDKHSDE